MKILQTPPRFYPYIGGVENYVYYLSKELVKRGHEVKVVCANEAGGSADMDGVKVERLSYPGKIANTNVTPALPFHLLKEDFDIVHTHLPTPWSADWSAIVSAIKRRPMVLTYHNDIVGSGLAGHIAKIYNATALKFLLKRAKRIIVCRSKYEVFSPLKEYKEKIIVVPIGVDTEEFCPSDTGTSNVLFFLSVLDEFHEFKGLDYLLDAMVLVKEEIPDARLRIGGGGKLLEYYKKKAVSMGLEDVEFLGAVPYEETGKYYNDSAAFILPSISGKLESFGIVLLEAMACGKPVVTTDVVGIAEEIKEAGAGVVVKTKDSKALANVIVRLLQDEKGAIEMGKNGRELVEEKYRWESVCKAIEDIYVSVV